MVFLRQVSDSRLIFEVFCLFFMRVQVFSYCFKKKALNFQCHTLGSKNKQSKHTNLKGSEDIAATKQQVLEKRGYDKNELPDNVDEYNSKEREISLAGFGSHLLNKTLKKQVKKKTAKEIEMEKSEMHRQQKARRDKERTEALKQLVEVSNLRHKMIQSMFQCFVLATVLTFCGVSLLLSRFFSNNAHTMIQKIKQ